jgi:glycosyltransferase involved in cell wall biosynthesis
VNILIIAPFNPYPLVQGGKIRIFNIIKYISKFHKVTLASIVDDERAEDVSVLRDYCDEVVLVSRPARLWQDRFLFATGNKPYNFLRYASDRMRAELADLLKRRPYDLVQVEFSMMWQYAEIFRGIPVVLDAHNVEHEIVSQLRRSRRDFLWRVLYAKEEERLKKEEKRAWRECDCCFAASNKEKETIEVYADGKVSVVPNGVDLERFQFIPKSEKGKKILLIGGMDYLPNLDSADYFLGDIYPFILSKLPDISLDVVGRELRRISVKDVSGSVRFHENVPDVLPFFRAADVLVVPLRMGAGTRVKILEAMAAGLPVVTTSKGCEGLEARHGEHLLIADSPADFSSSVRTVIEDLGLRKKLVHNARTLVEKKYSWEKIVAEMEKYYTTVNSEK